MSSSGKVVPITWRSEPPSPGQIAAGNRLWSLLLRAPAPQNTEAPVEDTKASKNFESGFGDQRRANDA